MATPTTRGGGDDDDEAEVGSCWRIDKIIPLEFSYLTRYMGDTDRLRVNAFEVRDQCGNIRSGVVHTETSVGLTSWVKIISEATETINQSKVSSSTQPHCTL